MWKAVAPLLASIGVFLTAFLAAAQTTTGELRKGYPARAKVFVYPDKLTAQDKLSFGPGNEQKATIPIQGESTLVYVDLAPDARFAHPTQCILISTDGARVLDGNWWLILNGKPLFRDGKAALSELAKPAEKKVSEARLKGMRDALADLEKGFVKQKDYNDRPDDLASINFARLMTKECGVNWERMGSQEISVEEMGGYNDVMRVEIEHRFGRGICEKLRKQAEEMR
jgi:hypothetical protein